MVHDSDIACYWLYENGKLLDEYNSCPNYFDDDDEPTGPTGGKTEILVRFCRPGVREDQLTTILNDDALFAEDLIQQLAKVLGIDPMRAITDYRHEGGGDESNDGNNFDGDDDDGGSPIPRRPKRLPDMLSGLLGLAKKTVAQDPKAEALVQAAVNDDVDAIDRLLSEGVTIDAEAPAQFAAEQTTAGLGQLLPAGVPKVAMTPLFAAVIHKHPRAVLRLLDGGADPNHAHPLFGTTIHAAVGVGEPELLRLLIDRGGNVKASNARGQTPLQAIEVGRATKDRLVQAQAMMKSMGMQIPGFTDQLSNVTLPLEGWDACEKLLKENGA
jgi:hypothetical protein